METGCIPISIDQFDGEDSSFTRGWNGGFPSILRQNHIYSIHICRCPGIGDFYSVSRLQAYCCERLDEIVLVAALSTGLVEQVTFVPTWKCCPYVSGTKVTPIANFNCIPKDTGSLRETTDSDRLVHCCGRGCGLPTHCAWGLAVNTLTDGKHPHRDPRREIMQSHAVYIYICAYNCTLYEYVYMYNAYTCIYMVQVQGPPPHPWSWYPGTSSIVQSPFPLWSGVVVLLSPPPPCGVVWR